MERRPNVHVVILYVHPLLGEGLAKLLSPEPGVTVTAVRGDDAFAVGAALAERPDVIVEERGDGARSPASLESAFATLRLFVGIDGPPREGDVEPMTADPELIVRAVRALRHRRMALVGV